MRAWAARCLVVGVLVAACGRVQGEDEGLVTEVEVEANVEHRYAITRVTTRIYNPKSEEAEVVLHMTLPEAALVSSFVMELGGANHSGNVNDRQEARQRFEEVLQQGRTEGLIELRDSDLQRVQVPVSVAGQASVAFHVTYEEMLHRNNGSFRYTVHLNPGQRVPRASIKLRVLEREAITNYRILELPGQEMTNHNPGTSVNGGPAGVGELKLTYQHIDPPVGEGNGVNGTFTVTYDITSYRDGGEVQRVNGYFVHFFSPERLPKMTAHTVFLLDCSLSMYGGKLDSVKEAMKAILRDMEAQDTFEILAFSSEVKSIGSFSGQKKEVKKANRKVQRLSSLGYSNLNEALLQALRAARTGATRNAVKQVVVFSDGRPTSGVMDTSAIRRNIKRDNSQHFPIFVFIFSEKSRLLEHIGGDSGGSARYVDLKDSESNAGLITALYREMAHPLMANVTITFPEEEVKQEDVVKQGMSNYYSGGEIVVAARLKIGEDSVHPSVSALGREGPHQLPATRLDSRESYYARFKDNYVARMWAYLMLQELLAQAAAPQNANKTQLIQSKALAIAKKFTFVSPLTSLVVVYPPYKSLMLSLPSGPQELQFDAPAAYVGRPGNRRGRNTGSNGPQTYVDLDPHFLVHTPGLHLPLCFDYEARAGVSVRLLHDPYSGIVINGQAASVRQRNAKFFSSLFMIFGPVNLTVTPETLEVDCLGDDGSPQVGTIVKSLWPFYKKNGRKYKYHVSGKGKAVRSHLHRKAALQDNGVTAPDTPDYAPSSLNSHLHSKDTGVHAAWRPSDDRVQDCSISSSWEEGVGRIYGNVMVVLSKDRSLDITIGDGLAHFTIKRSRNRRGRRYLGFYIKYQEIFSSQTHGMMGEFISKVVKRIYPPNPSASKTGSADRGAANTRKKVLLEVDRQDRRNKSRVSGVEDRRFSLNGRTWVKCIKVSTRGAEGVLNRPIRKYFLSCLKC